MVAGMTPSTVSAEFVSAVMNAGYHVELAGGGHYNEKMLRSKVDEIMKKTRAGEGITLNILFLNVRQWGFQYPLIQVMRKEGLPMEGVCVAAGVPSLDVANEVLENLQNAGIRHVAFKPGSIETIRQVRFESYTVIKMILTCTHRLFQLLLLILICLLSWNGLVVVLVAITALKISINLFSRHMLLFVVNPTLY